MPVPDPTLDDDNQSDSDEYEYEVIEEIEEVEMDTDELAHADDEPEINSTSHSQHLTISEGNLPQHLMRIPSHSFECISQPCSRDNYITRYQR